jgi:GT2 family glycosyltransferase
MTVHGRDFQTERLIKKIFLSAPTDWLVQIVVNIDGMHDATTTMLKQFNSNVHWLLDYEDSHWAKGMLKAQDFALANLEFNHIVWVNNDVDLEESALSRVSDNIGLASKYILVGNFSDEKSGNRTYGVSTYPKFRSMNWYRSIPISDQNTRVKVANANFMIFSEEIYRHVGGINGTYLHGHADSDIILRAHHLGIEARAIPGIMGFCPINEAYLSKSLPKMIAHEFSRKRSPVTDIKKICKAQNSPFWALLFLDYIAGIIYRQTKIWAINQKKAKYPNPWFRG